MSDTFRVRPAELESAAQAIGAAVDGIGTDGMSGVSADAVGHGQLATALADFADGWGRGLDQLVGDAQRFSVELHATAVDYQRQDDEVARSFAGSGEDGD